MPEGWTPLGYFSHDWTEGIGVWEQVTKVHAVTVAADLDHLAEILFVGFSLPSSSSCPHLSTLRRVRKSLRAAHAEVMMRFREGEVFT